MIDLALTAAATAQIQRSLEGRQKGLGIRLGVRTTGCSGLAYTLEFVDEADPTDLVKAEAGFSLYVSPKHAVYLKGLEVDYVRQGLNHGFEFLNPNESGRCGCGESFSI
ncbi:iron-sulfur cluster assembly accessory protein [Pseudomonas sp. CFBP 13719]|nr:iron-sulfur cluster assembly accessory protein [Pseudomonas sp. CFBP 13719]MBD8615127.1 iron-sulfur cluster assembly accessory protein [Pseudomonas putida]MBD8681198.1 iron-sulfur cluster assembly accessory protein [Pseudomonas sp. CFBP 13719]